MKTKSFCNQIALHVLHFKQFLIEKKYQKQSRLREDSRKFGQG